MCKVDRHAHWRCGCSMEVMDRPLLDECDEVRADPTYQCTAYQTVASNGYHHFCKCQYHQDEWTQKTINHWMGEKEYLQRNLTKEKYTEFLKVEKTVFETMFFNHEQWVKRATPEIFDYAYVKEMMDDFLNDWRNEVDVKGKHKSKSKNKK